MLKSAAVLFLGLATGIVYLVAGANFIGWNAVYGYGPKMIEWSLSLQAAEDPFGYLIYFHDVLVFLLLAIVLSIFSVKLVMSRLFPLFAFGVVLATLVGSFGLLATTEITISWLSTFIIVLIPLPILIAIRKLLFNGTANAV